MRAPQELDVWSAVMIGALVKAFAPHLTTFDHESKSASWTHTGEDMNVLMLDEERVVVEAQEERTIEAFKEWGFKPIPCNFRNFNTFGGSFHCATLDVRRRGGLQSYF